MKKITSLFFILSISLILTSCEKILNKNIDKVNNLNSEFKYELTKKDIFSTVKEYDKSIEKNRVHIFDVDGDYLYLGLMDKFELDGSNFARYKEIIKYDLSNDRISPILKLDKNMTIFDLVAKGERVFISSAIITQEMEASLLEEFDFSVFEVVSGKLKLIDEFPSSMPQEPYFAKLQNKIFYSSCMDDGLNRVDSIKAYDLEKNEKSVFYSEENSDLVITYLDGAGDNFVGFFESDNIGYFHIFDEDGLVEKIKLEENERISSYTPMKNGLILSYEDHDSQDKYVTKIKYVDMNTMNVNSRSFEKIYSLISAGGDYGLGINKNFTPILIRVDGEITSVPIDLNEDKSSLALLKDDDYYIYAYMSGYIYKLDI